MCARHGHVRRDLVPEHLHEVGMCAEVIQVRVLWSVLRLSTPVKPVQGFAAIQHRLIGSVCEINMNVGHGVASKNYDRIF
jgi:hypothetical protein